MQTNRWSIQDLTRMALLAALMCASAYIAFPIPITLVNVTAQTFVLNLVALLLTKEQFLEMKLNASDNKENGHDANE